MQNLITEIASKVARLPFEKQRETLKFVELLGEPETKKSFETVEGILSGNLDDLENDIGEIRRESLKNFPRGVEN